MKVFYFKQLKLQDQCGVNGAACTLAVFTMLSSISATKRQRCEKVDFFTYSSRAQILRREIEASNDEPRGARSTHVSARWT